MASEEKSQFIYVFEAIRPELVTDPDSWTEEETQIAENHVAYLKKATDEGVVLLAGRSLDGKGPALVVLDAASEEEARRFMENDPFVANGLFRAHLHPYRAAMVRKGYPSGKALGGSFDVNGQLIMMQADGLTHADSLLQLPFRGNCLNWVLGHILSNRSLERLLEDLERSQGLIKAALARVTPQEMAAPLEGDKGGRTLGELLVGLHWHETYHAGQLEILRQLAGKDDVVIA
jgi:uncharacterized protein YciI